MMPRKVRVPATSLAPGMVTALPFPSTIIEVETDVHGDVVVHYEEPWKASTTYPKDRMVKVLVDAEVAA